MNQAFAKLANGDFQEGLTELNGDCQWHDDRDTLDGPFCLGFPHVSGWGEGLLTASLLKRHAVASNQQIAVFARPQVCSILKHDQAFFVESVAHSNEYRSDVARSPLAILRHALTGDLLNFPFVPINLGTSSPQFSRSKPRIGIAWASIRNCRPVHAKSIPLDRFLDILGKDTDAEVISFQRKLSDNDCATLHARFTGRFTIVADDKLDAENQADVVKEIYGLDYMVTISTTTAHIAACLGVHVILIAAKRLGPQWFWRAQSEHGKCLYPSVDVILSSASDKPWWKGCLDTARKQFLSTLNKSA